MEANFLIFTVGLAVSDGGNKLAAVQSPSSYGPYLPWLTYRKAKVGVRYIRTEYHEKIFEVVVQDDGPGSYVVRMLTDVWYTTPSYGNESGIRGNRHLIAVEVH